MKLPNWFKVTWWLLLIGLLSTFLWHRYPELASGHAMPADIVVFVIWIALLLAPLFQEVSLLGVTLKQKIDDLKGYVASQVDEVKNEVRSAIDVRATFSPQFNIPLPANDAQLPEIEKRVKEVVSDALTEYGIKQSAQPSQTDLPEDILLLFATRYNLEIELRRIVGSRQLAGELSRSMPVMHLIRALRQAELIDPRLLRAIREVYSICSPAIHGEKVTQAQVAFVQDVGPDLISALRAIG